MPLATAPFDRAATLENLGGDEELLAQIASLFVASWPESLARLHLALAAADAEALRSAAHAVKGAVANFWAARAVQATRELELAGKSGDLAQAPQLLDAAVVAVEEVVAALNAELGL
ncbi:MAG: Hpt domain-containing protein [Rhodocyclaceae bacterium]|nr:Hpt domain-containing protein [Rhodocyclaceae bacterium]